ncbi:MAG: hypothetical protein CL878_05605 [Dehalococcoidia bacterium]|nr:hypothetical protein [Dehalococcoidia bacterium]
MATPELLAMLSRLVWVLSWLFAAVCSVVVFGSATLTGYSLYQRDTELARMAALLLGASALGLLLAVAGVRVASGF